MQAALWGLLVVAAGCTGTTTGNIEPEATPEGEPEAEVLGSVCGQFAEKNATVMDGGYALLWTSAPDPVPLNDQFDLIVDVTDADGTAAGWVLLDADAEMPQHGHGMNTLPFVDADPDVDGRFIVDGMQLHMPGEWKLHIDITDGDDGPTDRATFDVTCVE